MDGMSKDSELGYEKSFSRHQIQTVQRMRRAGHDNATIARAVGLTTSGFLWQMRHKKFGELPSRQGKSPTTRKRFRHDSEKDGVCFGTGSWKQRQIEIRNGWSEEEARRRQDGDLPNQKDNYGIFFRK